MGVYEKEPLSCPGHSDKNISNLLRNHKWSCYSSYISCTFIKLQGCKKTSKIINAAFLLLKLSDFSRQTERQCPN